MLTIPASTQEYIHIPVNAWSGDITDPTGLPVSIAITASANEPTETDWRDAGWATVNGQRHARILWRDAVPSPQPRTTYRAWLRITSNPETPILLAGTIHTL